MKNMVIFIKKKKKNSFSFIDVQLILINIFKNIKKYYKYNIIFTEKKENWNYLLTF